MKINEVEKTLFRKDTNRPNLFVYVKSTFKYKDLKKAIKIISRHSQGRYYLNSNSLPRSYKSLRKGKILQYSGKFQSEIGWILYSIIQNSSVINVFLLRRTEFEKAMLLENYDEARKILDSIEKDVCFSNWTLENRLLLEEKSNGTESNWLTLNSISKEINDSLLQFLAEQSSKKAEDKFSYSGYRSNFESIISGANPNVNEYLCFKLLYPGYIGFQNYGFYVNVESISSVIDRYIMLLDVLTDMAYEHVDFVSSIVEELSEKFYKDSRLEQIARITNTDFRNQSNIPNKLLAEVLDLYTVGHYKSVVEKSKKLIVSQPSSLEIYVLYCKSLIELDLDFTPTLISTTVDAILGILYSVFKINDEFNNSVEDGFKISLQLFSHDIGKQLSSVIGNYVMLRKAGTKDSIHYYVYSKFYNPSLAYHVTDKNYIISKLLSQNITDLIINRIICGDTEKVLSDERLPFHKRQWYNAKLLFLQEKFKELIEFYESNPKLIEQLHPYSLKEYFEIIYVSYSNLDDIEACITHFVKVYFKNPNYTIKFDRDLLKEEDAITQQNSVEAAIVSHIIGNDNYNVYVQYDNFLVSRNLDKPSEIDWNNESLLPYRVYFLNRVCSIDVMQYSIHFNGSEDVENQRLEILKMLLEFDSENTDDYIQQISEITRKSRVRNLIRDVNRGRITVNIQQLKEQESNLIKDKYVRFKALQEFARNSNAEVVDSTSKLISEYFVRIYEVNRKESFKAEKNDPAFAFYKLIFLELRDKFLFSKNFGLDGYLSTRIRHGTLSNHIRSVFETQNLLFQKKSQVYVPDNIWENNSRDIELEKIDSIKDVFIQFTEEVDDFTQTLVKDYIQIVTERKFDKERGLFDFTISDEDFKILYTESNAAVSNHTSLINYIFDILETMLLANLKSIRYVINNQVKDFYIDLLNRLQADLRQIDDSTKLILIYQSIARSQTEIINELQRISEWFNLSNPSTDTILDIETVVETALEITNTIYPNENLQVKIEDNSGVPFVVGTTNMIYICRIIFDNIIKHSGLSSNDRSVEVESKLIEDEKVLALSFKNNINPSLKGSIEKSLSKVKKDWEDNRLNYIKINVEGGSGYDKIRKMMAIDMQMDKYDFNFQVSDTNLTVILYFSVQIKSVSHEDTLG